MINWKVRLRNKTFWVTALPAGLLMVQAFLKIFGYEFSFDEFQQNAVNFINVFFAFMTILGVVVDPTTAGVKDSEKAMTYEKPSEIGGKNI